MNRKGFGLIEMLVAVIVIGVVVGGGVYLYQSNKFYTVSTTTPITASISTPSPLVQAASTTVATTTTASSTIAIATVSTSTLSSTTTTAAAPATVALSKHTLPKPVIIPAKTPPSASTTPVETSSPSAAPTTPNSTLATAPAVAPTVTPVDIQESPNVGLLCHYTINDAYLKQAYVNYEDANGDMLAKGSGVIVNSQGYILTAKHVVDPQWAALAYSQSTNADEVQLDQVMTLDYCDVGMPPERLAPSITELQSLNPSIVISNPFPYQAKLAFEPSQGTMSDNEYDALDFALLKISGPMANCQLFNECTLPSSFTYSPVLYSFTPDQSSQPNVLVNFGYPAEVINNSGGAFTDFYLKGTVGRLDTYYTGDQLFNNQPFGFQWDASDVLPGRSGSPVYWQGYVVGVDVSQNTDNSTMDNAVGMPVIQKVLNANGLGRILQTQ